MEIIKTWHLASGVPAHTQIIKGMKALQTTKIVQINLFHLENLQLISPLTIWIIMHKNE